MNDAKRNCRATALGLLSRREHSRVELLRKLASKGFGKAEIEHLLDELEAERLLSDERFVESYVHSRKQRGFGPLRVKLELRERGVANETMVKWLDEEATEWLVLAREQHQKKFGSQPAKDLKARAQQVRFLMNRGFSHEMIAKILR